MKRKFEVDDRVQYSTKFLRSTGQLTGDICQARGSITAFKDIGPTCIVIIQWDSYEGHSDESPGVGRVCISNIERTPAC